MAPSRLGVADRHLGAAALEGQVAVAAGLVGDQRLDLLLQSLQLIGAAFGSAGDASDAGVVDAPATVSAKEVQPDRARVAARPRASRLAGRPPGRGADA